MTADKQPNSSQFAALLATAQGKIVSALAVIGLVLGIASEVISLGGNYADMWKRLAACLTLYVFICISV